MKKIFFAFCAGALLFSCQEAATTVSTHARPVVAETAPNTEAAEKATETAEQTDLPPATEEDDCVFDTSYHQFTTEMLRKYKRNIAYRWNKSEKQAMAFLPGGDTLLLSIGGCVHFNYSAELLSGIPFEKQEELLRKAAWIATTFFKGSSFGSYAGFIERKQYQQEASEPGYRAFGIILDSENEELTNDVYDGFSFRSVGGGKRTRISISGYVN